MRSLTKADVGKKDILNMCQRGFGMKMREYHELNEGMYNISYLVVLEDGREAVLKVAPPAGVKILTYEIDIMKAEVEFYKLCHQFKDLPVPAILFEDFSLEIFTSPYYFMTKLEGIPLNRMSDSITADQRIQVYKQVARYLARIHEVKGDTYGYISMKDQCNGKTYHDAFKIMVEALFDDAKRVSQTLPIPHDLIHDLIERCKDAFMEVEEPCLVHYDLWDGNIFVESETDFTIDGIIDFERGFYGDCAADFSQVAGYVNLDESQYFFDEYNKFAVDQVTFDAGMRVRIFAYRLYVVVIMYVECYYRDIEGSFEPQRHWVIEQFPIIIDQLEKALEAYYA